MKDQLGLRKKACQLQGFGVARSSSGLSYEKGARNIAPTGSSTGVKLQRQRTPDLCQRTTTPQNANPAVEGCYMHRTRHHSAQYCKLLQATCFKARNRERPIQKPWGSQGLQVMASEKGHTANSLSQLSQLFTSVCNLSAGLVVAVGLPLKF